MPRQQRSIQTSREARVLLASRALQEKRVTSQRQAAMLYDAPRTTLRRRLRGTQPRSETASINRKLSAIEEQSLIQWILELDRRGFPPHIIDVRRMADALLAARGQDPPPPPVGKNWVSRFIQGQPELQTKWTRRLHSQRASYEDPAIIAAWFKLVEETRQTYGVLDQDIYNFDETGFAMGVAATSKVVTSADRVGRAVVVQPGNREWVTAIECVNASGWCLPPFVILSGKVHQSNWYRNLLLDWTVGVSDNGWTTDELGVEWVKHFDQHTAARTAGVYRLLILDGHSSHATPEFDQYCANNKIITLSQAVVQIETPHTVAELQQQVRYLQERLRRQPESPTSIAIRQLAKSAQLAMQSATILTEENKRLREENQRQRQKQDQQRQYIASGGALQVRQAQQLTVEAERVVIEAEQVPRSRSHKDSV
ncbi:Transposase [Pyrenophora tritici-repentis]|nr:Transposase [Pyrenophora tritici-repentis]